MKTNILKVFGFAALLGVAQGAFATVVTTEAQLEAALAAGGTVTLGADIALTHEHQVGNTVVLDLGTYTISSTTNIFQVIENGNFTVNADATNPGGLTTPSDRCCIFTSYGWHPGPKTVTINGGVFMGNCVFNWATNVASQVPATYYGLALSGGGSGEKAVPTSVTVNGGIFEGGHSSGNFAAYRCYYLTVNGGTFNRGIDSADTATCSIGVTSTCKAFFKGGAYLEHYPTARDSKVFIGNGSVDYVYYIEDGHCVIAPDYSECEAKATFAFPRLFDLFGLKLWITSSQEWHFRYLAEAYARGTNVVPANSSNAQENPETDANTIETVSAPVRSVMKSVPKKAALMGAAPEQVERPCATFLDRQPSDFKGEVCKLLFPNREEMYPIYKTAFCKSVVMQMMGGVDPGFETAIVLLSQIFPADYLSDLTADAWANSDQWANEITLNESTYGDWPVVVTVSFDKKVAANSVELLVRSPEPISIRPDLKSVSDGKIPQDCEAGVALELRRYETHPLIYWDWKTAAAGPEACWYIGATNLDPANNGTTMTVRMYLKKNYQDPDSEEKELASYTYTFGGEQPQPVDPEIDHDKKAEDNTPSAADVIDGKTEVVIIEIDEGGQPKEVKVDSYSDPKAAVVVQTMGDIKENSKNEEIKGTDTGIGEVPTEAQEGATDFNKWLRRETVGIAIDTSAAVAKLDSISFEVEPLIETIVEDGEGNKTKTEPQKISNEEIKASGKSIKVILPLSDDFRVSAKVRHESEDPNYPPEEFILPVLGVAGGRYVEITTTHFSTFTLSPYNAVVTESDETLGIVKVAKTAGGETVAGVPFRKFDVTSGTAKAMTVDQLLVAGFGEDDDIYAYNPTKPSGDEYDMWAWDGEKWDIVPGPTQPPAAESAAIASGKAFWFKDESGSTTPLTLAGLYQENVTTTTDAGTAGVPKMTLLVNPYNAPVNATEKIATGAATGDQIVFVNGSGRYEFKEGEGWGTVQATEKTVTIGGQTRTVRGPDQFVAVEGGLSIPAGQAFWYVSKGGNPTVAW